MIRLMKSQAPPGGQWAVGGARNTTTSPRWGSPVR